MTQTITTTDFVIGLNNKKLEDILQQIRNVDICSKILQVKSNEYKPILQISQSGKNISKNLDFESDGIKNGKLFIIPNSNDKLIVNNMKLLSDLYFPDLKKKDLSIWYEEFLKSNKVEKSDEEYYFKLLKEPKKIKHLYLDKIKISQYHKILISELSKISLKWCLKNINFTLPFNLEDLKNDYKDYLTLNENNTLCFKYNPFILTKKKAQFIYQNYISLDLKISMDQ